MIFILSYLTIPIIFSIVVKKVDSTYRKSKICLYYVSKTAQAAFTPY